MSRVIRIFRFLPAAFAAAFLAFALTASAVPAQGGERGHIKRQHAVKHHAPRQLRASGRRTDLYGYKTPRIGDHGHVRSGVKFASGRRTEGIHRWRKGWDHGRDFARRGDLLPGFDYRTRRYVSDARRFDPYIRDRGYDGYDNGFGYGRDWGYDSGPLVIPVTGDAGVPADSAIANGSCQTATYCVVRLGPYANSPKIITLNATGNPGEPDLKAAPPVEDPEVYELDVPEEGVLDEGEAVK
jgi:hypothetical protein